MLQLAVTRTGVINGAVSVGFATGNGTAIAGIDFTAVTGTLSWAAGDSSAKTIPVAVTDEQLTSGSKTFSVTLSAAQPALTWMTPPPLASGQPLTSAQLDASASVPGVFTYSPALGVVPPAGSQTLSASFAPTDSVDYANASITTSLTVPPPVNADCNRYSYVPDQTLCRVNSVAAPNAIAVRASKTSNSPNTPIVAMPADNRAVSLVLSAITTTTFVPTSYTWTQVQPVIDTYAAKSTASFSSAQTSVPEVSVSLPASGIYQF